MGAQLGRLMLEVYLQNGSTPKGGVRYEYGKAGQYVLIRKKLQEHAGEYMCGTCTALLGLPQGQISQKWLVSPKAVSNPLPR